MITEEKALVLLKGDLISIGREADKIRQAKHGKKSYYILNRQINYSNICITRCKFCAFAKSLNQKGGYVLDHDKILKIIGERKADEVHIVGGIHPDLPFSYYIEMIEMIRSKYKNIWIKAFTAAEIDYFSHISGLSVETVLKKLKSAGINSLPGGGAEIFSERVRQILYPNKISADRWLLIHKTAHLLGLKTNATILFGHIETDVEIVEHLFRLKKLQEETNGFDAFIALPFHPGNSMLDLPPVSAIKILKVIALSRIILSNFDHIKAYWVMLTPKLAEIAQFFGADDLDGTIGKERVTHSANTISPAAMSELDLRTLMINAGFLPVRRTGNYRIAS